jgi:hypothetical protein
VFKIILLASTIALSGCSTLGTTVANYYNSQDPCQLKNNGGRYPTFCGASGSRTVIYETQHAQPLGVPRYYINR